jgi:hypothetical protein
LQAGLDSPNQIETAQQIGVLAQTISRVSRPAGEASCRKMII